MGNIIRCFTGGDHDHGDDNYYPYYRTASRWEDEYAAASQPHRQFLGPIHGGVTPASTASLARDLRLNFESTSMIPEGLKRHVRSSKKAQTKWYKDMEEKYKDMKTPRKTADETALTRIQRTDLEDIFSFYKLPTTSLPAPDSNHHSTLPPEGVQFVLNTLPVHNKCIGDGDGFTAYVDTADPRESTDVPLEVHQMVIAITQARTDRDYQTVNDLQRSLDKAGYKVIVILGKEILARKYRIRMRGIDAPELKMPYGKEAKKELMKLIGGKNVTIYVYEQDQFGRYVGDIYCDNMFIQEQMLRCGHVHHFKKYDKRPEFENVCSTTLNKSYFWEHVLNNNSAVAERGKIYRPRTLGIKEAPSEPMGLEKKQAKCKTQCHSGLLMELSSSQGSDSHEVPKQLATNECVSVTKSLNVQLMFVERENTLSEVLSCAVIMHR